MLDRLTQIVFGPLAALAIGACVPSPGHASDKVREPSHALSRCAASAMAPLFDDVTATNPDEDEWTIRVKIVGPKTDPSSLAIDIAAVGRTIGGGGEFFYDCKSGELKLIEGDR